MKNKIINPRLLKLLSHYRFKMEGSLYIPEMHTKEYKMDILREDGLGVAVSYSMLFGSQLSLNEIKKLLSIYDPVKLRSLVCQLAKYIARAGRIGDVNKCKVQQNFLLSAIQAARTKGLYESIDPIELKHSAVISWETINALLALSILAEDSSTAVADPSINKENFALGCIALNDHVFANSLEEVAVQSDDFYYNNAQRAWFYGPLACSETEYFLSAYRFSVLSSSFMKQTQLSEKIQNYFFNSYNVCVDDFVSLMPAINVNWITFDDSDYRSLLLLDEHAEREEGLRKLMKKISLSLEEYREELSTLEKEYGDKFITHYTFLNKLINFPFLSEKIKAGELYHLLAPQLLVRHIQLSPLRKAFISEKKDENITPATFDGVMGKVVEAYAQQLIENCVDKSRGPNEGMPWKPEEKESEELTDFAIIHPNTTIIFEIKYRNPPLIASELTKEGLDKFKKWIYESFFISPAEAKGKKQRITRGALYQLEDAALKILTGKAQEIGVVPKSILPVIIVSQDLIFSLDFYNLIDRFIKEKNLFEKRSEVLPPLLLGLGELEFIYGLNFGEKGISFRELLIEKASSARYVAWQIFIKAHGLKYQTPEECVEAHKQLSMRCSNLLKLPPK